MLSASEDTETDVVYRSTISPVTDADARAGIAVIDLRFNHGEAIQQLFELAAKDVPPVVAIHADRQTSLVVDFAFAVASDLGLEVGYLKITSPDAEDNRDIDGVTGPSSA